MTHVDGEAELPLRPAPGGPEPVDTGKVAALREAVEAGTLRTDAQHIALRLLVWERLLRGGS